MRNIMNEQLSISKSLPLRARFYDYAHFTYPWHFHSEYEIIYFREGTGTRFVGNNIARYSHGDVLLIGTNLPHYMKSDDLYHSAHSTLRVKGTIIQFERDFMYTSMNNYPQFAKIKRLLDDSQGGICFPAGCSGKLTQMLESIPSETGLNQIISCLLLLEEMTGIDSRQIITSFDSPIHAGSGATRINKILSYLNTNYDRNIDLEEIASYAAMNATSFCRYFRKATGKSFKTYILDMRISYACKLLLLDDITISQISTQCGFDTISYFNKTFKKNTGYSPSTYRDMVLSLTRPATDSDISRS